jgi:hypothetical protein
MSGSAGNANESTAISESLRAFLRKLGPVHTRPTRLWKWESRRFFPSLSRFIRLKSQNQIPKKFQEQFWNNLLFVICYCEEYAVSDSGFAFALGGIKANRPHLQSWSSADHSADGIASESGLYRQRIAGESPRDKDALLALLGQTHHQLPNVPG